MSSFGPELAAGERSAARDKQRIVAARHVARFARLCEAMGAPRPAAPPRRQERPL